jgi:leucyl-tRNA synthetase
LWEKTSPHPSPSKERERLQWESWFTSIFFEKWPKYDEKIVVDNEIEIAIQVLGKLRGTIKISKNEEQESVLTKAKANEEVKKWLEGKEIVKEIYVPWKIVNFVIK